MSIFDPNSKRPGLIRTMILEFTVIALFFVTIIALALIIPAPLNVPV